MNEQKFFLLINALARDLNTPEFFWTASALVVALVLSWWISRHLREPICMRPRPERSVLRAFGAGGMKRLAFPLVAVVLLLVTRRVLRGMGWEHLSLFDLVVPLLVAWLLARVVVYVLRCVFSDGGFLSAFERFITTAVWVGMVLDMTGLADPVVESLEQVTFVVGKQRLDLWIVLHGAVTVAATLLLALWIASLVENRLMAANRMDANLREVLARLAKAFLSVIALLLSLSLVGIDVTALSVFSGALAVGLGFGLQKIASNYVSGFIILLDRSIRLGNLVAVDDKTTGTITQITTRYTVLRTLVGTEVIIPNEYLVSNIVRNLSYTDTRVRATTSVQVAYDTDLEQVIQLLVGVARRHSRVLADPAPGVLVTGFADNGINLELGFWVADPEIGIGGIVSDLNLAIWKTFREHGVVIPYPQREVRLLSDPA
ncbi:mechanosensitive ion channel family protein [Propionivibrio dicarboxylicus]|uniref:Mechanosensitive ion channel n=1 Tax=Propionivibrio dicarboxylicus TaxID=83767 RepID=A0A1G8HJF0_9RHOO|nr:mechanosensitive ion channel domain-containing protein [Propionivibrio dicarboxylicus]SDI06725.1 Mechanosensitive ion channel [Propionivibrio dicarboxylicus]